jgi:hypothetical protein
MLMGSMPGPLPLTCPPDDVLIGMGFLLGFGFAAFIFLVLAHILRR